MYQKMRDFFWFCAGVNRRLLLECDTAKYFGIGATVFFTAIFAWISAGYALYFVFSGSPLAVLIAAGIGLVWGLTIFNIDRYLVLSIRKEGKFWRELGMALPRLLLAIMIGTVIARPLELKIFDKEIREGLKQYYLENEAELVQAKAHNFELQFGRELAREQVLKKTVDSVSGKVDEDRHILRKEFLGEPSEFTSGVKGWGKYFDDEKKTLHSDSLAADLDEKQLSSVQQFLDTNRMAAGLTRISSLDDPSLDSIVKSAGFYDRNKILGQLSSWTPWNAKPGAVAKDSTSHIDHRVTIQRLDGKGDPTVFFISLLFITVECLPILVKLLSHRSNYDIRLEEEEDRLQFLSRHETFANKHLIRQLAISQREVLDKAIDQWKNNELNSDTLGDRYIHNDDENEPA